MRKSRHHQAIYREGELAHFFKQVFGLILFTVRTTIVFTMIWLIVELIYFKQTGGYLVYYGFWRKTSNNIFYVVYHVFKARNGQFANIFTNYIAPTVLKVSAFVFCYDLYRIFESKRYAILCAIDLLLTLTMFGLIYW